MAPPRVIADRYELDGPLGRGGMAEVYAAHDRVLDRSVAIKVLAERFTHDDRFVTRFRREAQSAARLNHRNIVSVYDTGSAEGTPYIVMEKVDGPTLADVLAAEGPLPPGRAAEIGAAVAEALEAAHREGLVHRDVKPGNIMLAPGSEVKVVDFGIARAAADDTLTQTGTVLGTASYLSPEQASGDPVDARSDVYSLGCVLYEMLTGRPPFSADAAVQVAYKQVHEDPRPPAQAGTAIPPALEEVVMRALRKDPQERYASGGAMREALLGATATGEAPTEPVARGGDTAVLPSQTPPAAPPPDEQRPGRRWLVPLAALLLAGLLAAGAFALLGDDGDGRRERQRARQPVAKQPAEQPADQSAGPLTVEEAFAAFQTVVNEGVALGEVEEGTGGAILGRAGDALAAYGAADLDAALANLDQAALELERAADEGTVASPDRFEAIGAALAALREAMESDPPVVEETIPEDTPVEEQDPPVEGEDDEGEEDEGDGGGQGKGEEKSKGKAKGHDE